MAQFAALLSAQTDRPVQDGTRIPGVFNISLQWTSEDPGTKPAETPAGGGLSIYTAVQEQLGLRLDPRNAPIEYLVVVHVEKPTAN